MFLFLFFLFFSNNIFIEIISCYKIITLPFQELINISEKNIYNSSLFLNNYLEYKTFTEISIGTPPKRLPFFINSNIKIFRLRKGELSWPHNSSKYNNYVPSQSSSFINISNTLDFNFFNYKYSFVNDTIILCDSKDCNKEIEINNSSIQLENIYNTNESNYKYIYGEFGFSTSKSNGGILNDLKKKGIINSIIITIEYTSDKEGVIYIGEYPHIYNNNKYSEGILMTAYNIPVQGNTNQLKFKFSRLYLIDKDINEYIDLNNNIILFNFGLGIILCTKEYYDKIIEIFFSKYINLNICKINIEKKGRNEYYIISCEKREEFKIDEFPSLYLFKEEFKYIFELNYKDLFQEINKIYYFSIVYFPFSDTYFELGKPFFKKYQITYNENSNTIQYYNELLKKVSDKTINNKNINNESVYIISIVGEVIIILGIITLVAILKICKNKHIWHKKKLRINRIYDEYEYNSPIIDLNS